VTGATVRAGDGRVEVADPDGTVTVQGGGRAGDGAVTLSDGGSKVTVDGRGSVSIVAEGDPDDHADIVVDEGDLKRTYDCHGGSATVNGGGNDLTFRNCQTITINGAENTVDAGAVRRLLIHGTDNKVTWAAGTDGSRPSISNRGESNVVRQSRP